MENEKIDKLIGLLENISETYDDFIDGTLENAYASEEFTDKLINFIESNPEATSYDVINFEIEELFDIKPFV